MRAEHSDESTGTFVDALLVPLPFRILDRSLVPSNYFSAALTPQALSSY